MSARRTGTTLVNPRQVRRPRQPTAWPPASAAVTLASEQLADAPLGMWSLQEASGSTAIDSSGNGRNGTIGAGVTLAQTPINSVGTYSASFGGAATGRIDVSDGAWMDVDNYTTEALVSFNVLSGYRSWMSRDDGGSNRLWTSVASETNLSNIGWNSGGTIYLTTRAGVATSTAYLIVQRWDSATHKMSDWLNGVKLGDTTTTGTAKTGTSNLVIGAAGAPGGTIFAIEAKISHVAFYGTALSDARILAHAQAAGLA